MPAIGVRQPAPVRTAPMPVQLPQEVFNNAQQQAVALRNPEPINIHTEVNPFQRQAFDDTGRAMSMTEDAYRTAADYEKGLAEGTNAEIRRELGRARDSISTGMRAEGEAAMARGADPSLFRSRALLSGKRDLHALQGQLADVALRRREGAVNAKTAAAGGTVGAAGTRASAAASAAGEQRMMHLGVAGQRLAEQRAVLEQAEVQSRLNEAPYQRMIALMDATTRARTAGLTATPATRVGGGTIAGGGLRA